MSLANDKRPLLFESYLGNLGAVNYLKSIIKTNKHPNGIVISGFSGVGKTTLAQLYVKATLCEQRQEHEFEPCNNCDSCLKTIQKNQHPNVTYYSITEASIFKEAVSDLIQLTKASPVITHKNLREDNQHRFIIIDEVQSASRQSISPFLDSLEFAVANVTVILISMDLDKMDSIVRDAIESRCIELALNQIEETHISQKLQSFYEDLHPSSSDLIAYLSKGNVRKAWQLLEYFLGKIDVSLLTPTQISEEKLGGLCDSTCSSLIFSLQSQSWAETELLLKNISSNEIKAITYFVSFLVKENLNKEGLLFLSSLSFWLQSHYKIPISALFKVYQGRLITEPPLNKSTESFVKSNTSSLNTHASVLDLKQASNSVIAQLEHIVGSTLSIPLKQKIPCLLFKEWSMFLTHYADNN